MDSCIQWNQTRFITQIYRIKYSWLTFSSWAIALFPKERMCRFRSVSRFSMTEMRLLNKLKSWSFTRESSPSITSILLNDKSEEYKNYRLLVSTSVLIQQDNLNSPSQTKLVRFSNPSILSITLLSSWSFVKEVKCHRW